MVSAVSTIAVPSNPPSKNPLPMASPMMPVVHKPAAVRDLRVVRKNIRRKRRRIRSYIDKIVKRLSPDFVGIMLALPEGFFGFFADTAVSSDGMPDDQYEYYETCKNRVFHTIILPDIPLKKVVPR